VNRTNSELMYKITVAVKMVRKNFHYIHCSVTQSTLKCEFQSMQIFQFNIWLAYNVEFNVRKYF